MKRVLQQIQTIFINGLLLLWTFAWLASLVFAIPHILVTRDSQNWPRAAGQVLSTRLSSSEAHKKGTLYCVQLDYSYAVAGQIYHAQTISDPPPCFAAEQDAKQALSTYAIGKPIQVFYNPKIPAISFLKPEQNHIPDLWFMTLLLGGYSLAGIGGLYLNYRRWRRKKLSGLLRGQYPLNNANRK